MATKQISQLTTKPSPVASTDQFGIDDVSSDSWKITALMFLTYVNANATIAESQVTNLVTDLSTINSAISGKLAIAQNLNDLADKATSRTNLGVPAGSGTSTGTNTGDQTSVSGNAGSATTTATTDDTTTNATVYLVWKTATTGNLAEKVSSTKMSFNPSTGMFTVTGVTSEFTGNLIGNVTGNVTGNVSGSSGSCSGNAATATLAANVTTNANLTGPVTSTGNATAIANGAISNAMLANSAVANLSGTNTGDQTITLTGDVTGSGTGSFAATIAANAVTYAKMQQAATVTLLGNPTGGTANIQQITLGTNLSFSGSVLNATGGGSSPLTTKGDIFCYSTTNARQPAGSNSQFVFYDSTQTTGLNSDFPNRPIQSPSNGYFYDFMGTVNGTPISTGAQNSGSATYQNNFASDGTGEGWAKLSTNANSSGEGAINLGLNTSGSIYMGGGTIIAEANINISALSNGTDRYILYIGFCDVSTQSLFNHGAWLQYSDNVNSGQWVSYNYDTSGATVNSTTAPAATTTYRVRCVVNAAGTSLTWYINDVSIVTNATHLPTTYPLGFQVDIKKTVGTTAVTCSVDYLSYQKVFTTPR